MSPSEKALDLRIALQGSEPEIWRTLRVPVSAPLNHLHYAIQRAFGWEDRHLHLFHPGGVFGEPRPIAGDDESAFELGLESAAGMTVGQLLAGEDGRLEYEYDLGDSWIHGVTIAGHALVPAGKITCLGGAHRGPLEDAGGMVGYQEKCRILADPQDPEHAEIATWYQYVTGRLAREFDPAAFDLDAVNQSLDRLSLLLAEPMPTPDDRAEVLRPVRWLLDRAREDGLELTKDGYLKPALVRETVDAVVRYKGWMGPANREVNTPEVALLREQLQEWKLLRKYKGRLLPTPEARKTYDDDGRLWDYLTARLADQDNLALQVGMRSLVEWLLNDQVPTYRMVGHAMVSTLVHAGLRPADGGQITEADGSSIYYEVWRQLKVLDVFEPDRGLAPAVPTPAGIKFLLDLRRKLAAAE